MLDYLMPVGLAFGLLLVLGFLFAGGSQVWKAIRKGRKAPVPPVFPPLRSLVAAAGPWAFLAALGAVSMLPAPCSAAGATETLLTPAAWVKLGPSFGPDSSWQFGFDKSATAGACAEYNIADRRFEAGPCRDIFLLARTGAKAMHLGGSIMFPLDDFEHKRPAYGTRFGINTGPAARAGLSAISAKVPYLDQLAAYRPPKWASYLGDIASVDFSGSWRPKPVGDEHRFPYGVQAKVDIPLDDLLALFSGSSK